MTKKLVITFVLCGFLAGCGSTTTPEPIGIGRGNDELKRSPCACIEVQQDYDGWMVKT